MEVYLVGFLKIWRIQNGNEYEVYDGFEAGSFHLRFQDSVLRRTVTSLQTLQDNICLE